MAHKRKDTLTRPLQWWKHLKDYKRPTSKRERRASKKDIDDRKDQLEGDDVHTPKSI